MASYLGLVEIWRRVSARLGREEESHALELQAIIARGWTDGDAVLAAREPFPERFAPLGAGFVEEWRELVVREALRPISAANDPPGTAWVRGLVDTAASRSAPAYRRTVTTWLRELVGSRDTLHRLEVRSLDPHG